MSCPFFVCFLLLFSVVCVDWPFGYRVSKMGILFNCLGDEMDVVGKELNEHGRVKKELRSSERVQNNKDC